MFVGEMNVKDMQQMESRLHSILFCAPRAAEQFAVLGARSVGLAPVSDWVQWGIQALRVHCGIQVCRSECDSAVAQQATHSCVEVHRKGISSPTLQHALLSIGSGFQKGRERRDPFHDGPGKLSMRAVG